MSFKSGIGSGRNEFVPPALEITSMMDMFTIIVFFLLFAYSDKPQEITIKEKIQLPISTSTKDYSNSVKIVISDSKISVNDEVVGLIKDEKIFGLNREKIESSVIFKTLRDKKKEADKLKKLTGLDERETVKPPSVIFFCDRKVPYNIIQTIMKVSGMAGYPNFQLAILNEQ